VTISTDNGELNMVEAVVDYIRAYADHYTLGRETKPGEWEPLEKDEVPSWAHRHQPLFEPKSL
jgi:hypothetical protein